MAETPTAVKRERYARCPCGERDIILDSKATKGCASTLRSIVFHVEKPTKERIFLQRMKAHYLMCVGVAMSARICSTDMQKQRCVNVVIYDEGTAWAMRVSVPCKSRIGSRASNVVRRSSQVACNDILHVRPLLDLLHVRSSCVVVLAIIPFPFQLTCLFASW